MGSEALQGTKPHRCGGLTPRGGCGYVGSPPRGPHQPPSTSFCCGCGQRGPPRPCPRAHFFPVSQTAVYIFVCVNNLKYEGFALLLPPLDNINYRREPSSLEKKGEKKNVLEKLQALQVFKGPSASPPNCKDKCEQQ